MKELKLETERLILRTYRLSDFEDHFKLCADPDVMRYLIGGKPLSRFEAWRHMAFAVGHWQLQGAGIWVTEEQATGAFVGMIGFWEPAAWPGFELSGHIARRFWGQGYASEGARAAMAYAFNVPGRERLISLVNPANHASIRVVERIGERLEGRIDHLGRQMLLYGLDRATYLREVAPADATARRAG